MDGFRDVQKLPWERLAVILTMLALIPYMFSIDCCLPSPIIVPK